VSNDGEVPIVDRSVYARFMELTPCGTSPEFLPMAT
jgi:hypothetical protein